MASPLRVDSDRQAVVEVSSDGLWRISANPSSPEQDLSGDRDGCEQDSKSTPSSFDDARPLDKVISHDPDATKSDMTSVALRHDAKGMSDIDLVGAIGPTARAGRTRATRPARRAGEPRRESQPPHAT